jgi:hypothetical protein
MVNDNGDARPATCVVRSRLNAIFVVGANIDVGGLLHSSNPSLRGTLFILASKMALSVAIDPITSTVV